MKRAACLLIVNPHTDMVRVVNRRGSTQVGMPGGKVEANEWPIVAAVRETHEECGIFYDFLLNELSRQPLYVAMDGEFEVHTFLVFDWTHNERSDGCEDDISSYMTTWDDLCANSPFVEYNAAVKLAYESLVATIA